MAWAALQQFSLEEGGVLAGAAWPRGMCRNVQEPKPSGLADFRLGRASTLFTCDAGRQLRQQQQGPQSGRQHGSNDGAGRSRPRRAFF